MVYTRITSYALPSGLSNPAVNFLAGLLLVMVGQYAVTRLYPMAPYHPLALGGAAIEGIAGPFGRLSWAISPVLSLSLNKRVRT
jgi:hypothetical protein